MSTRATVHFKSSTTAKPDAIVYRHGDGYPAGLGKDLKDFLKEVKKQCGDDTRFDDPCYLAAKWVVCDAARMARYRPGYKAAKGNARPLHFLSVGIVKEDPGDIEHRYHVICSGGTPKIVHEEVR